MRPQRLPRFNGGHDDTPRELLAVRLKCVEADKGSLSVMSTIDQTYRLDTRSDELVRFTSEDVVVIKNRREDPCKVEFVGDTVPSRVVLRPSRQAQSAYTLRAGETLEFIMGGGETITLTADSWIPQTGRGASVAA